MTAQRPATAADRALAPDLARGMMLLLIALANVPWHLWGRTARSLVPGSEGASALDRGLHALSAIAIDQRSYPMFAFLFGYGMVQFAASRRARGIPERTVRIMLRRRHWGMLLLGLLHAALLFSGDVLGAYAVGGLLLVWCFFSRRDRTVAIWTGIIGALLLLSYLMTAVAAVMMVLFPDEAQVFDAHSIGAAVAGTASYPASMSARLLGWAVLTPAQLIGSVIVPAILLGWLAARHRLLEDVDTHRRLLTGLAIIGIAIGWLGGLPTAIQHLGILQLPASISGWALNSIATPTGLLGGIGYACAFALVAERWQSARGASGSSEPTSENGVPVPARAASASASALVLAAPPAPVRWIAAVGQRSLTFYLLQSAILAPLLCAWGLGLGDRIGYAGALGLALLVWLASVGAGAWFAATGKRGPAEVLLRRMTYGNHEPAQR